jgi:beta-lactamase regulating signal transducer with metallopeptidase domain
MMNHLGKLFPDIFISSVGWTIIHSLWQGAIIALVFGSIMAVLKRSSSKLRYIVGVSVLILTVLITMITFVMVYSAEISGVVMQEAKIHNLAEMKDNSLLVSLKIYFEGNLPTVVILWFLGVIFFFFRFLSGLLYSRRLRNYNRNDVSEFWQEKLSEFCIRMKIKKQISIWESTLIKTPLVIGHLKPLILFPAGMMLGMSPEQVESLIIHELAHVLRSDYLMNLFQNIIDIVYFYHPGIKWISSEIRNERENCCDDITVLNTGNSFNYAKALVNVGQKSLNLVRNPALAAAGNSTRLFKRIRRLFNMRNNNFSFKDGILSFMLMSVFVISFVVCVNAAVKTDRTAEYMGDNLQKEKSVEKSNKMMRERLEKLKAKKAELLASEKNELLKIERQLAYLKKMGQEKRLQKLHAEHGKLKEESNLKKEKRLKKFEHLLKEEKLKMEEIEQEHLSLVKERKERKELKLLEEKVIKNKHLTVYKEYEKLLKNKKNLTEEEVKKLKQLEDHIKKIREESNLK